MQDDKGSGRDVVWVCGMGFKPTRILAGYTKDLKRVHIITQAGEDRGAKHVAEAKKLLEENDRNVFVKVHPCNIFDPISCYETLNRIIADEARKGSKVFFNLTPGGTVMAAVGYHVASLHGVSAFYVEAEEYGFDGHSLSRGAKGDPIVFPRAPRELPNTEQVAALEFLHRKGGAAHEDAVKKHLKAWVDGDPFAKDWPKSRAANINVVLETIEKETWVSRSPDAPGILKLTPYGKEYHQMFHGILPEKPPDPKPPRKRLQPVDAPADR